MTVGRGVPARSGQTVCPDDVVGANPAEKDPADKAPASLIMIFSAATRISGIMLFGIPKELRIL
jgi:hypothetical protein